MARILLGAQASVGHTNPLRAIGRCLRKLGHDVAFVVPKVGVFPGAPETVRAAASIADGARKDGLDVFELRPSLSALWHGIQIARSTGYDELHHAIGMFTAGLASQAQALASIATSWRADVVVADYLFFQAVLAAQLTKLPFATVFHSALPFPSDGNPPFGSGLLYGAPVDDVWRTAQKRLNDVAAYADARIARGAKALGLAAPPVGVIGRPYSYDLNILTTLAALEPGLRPLEGPVLFAGPITGDRAGEGHDDPALRVVDDDAARGKRLVYVSLGTVFNNKPDTFAAILRGLDDDDTIVVVSAGAAADALLAKPPSKNARIFKRVPQVALLSRVDVVVTHGGNNTVQETLQAGRPMVVIPFGGDQLENGTRVSRLGAGVALLPAQVSSSSVQAAVDRVGRESAFKAAAAQAARAIEAAGDGTRKAADAIVALVLKA